jgi:hypothetical protein
MIRTKSDVCKGALSGIGTREECAGLSIVPGLDFDRALVGSIDRIKRISRLVLDPVDPVEPPVFSGKPQYSGAVVLSQPEAAAMWSGHQGLGRK